MSGVLATLKKEDENYDPILAGQTVIKLHGDLTDWQKTLLMQAWNEIKKDDPNFHVHLVKNYKELMKETSQETQTIFNSIIEEIREVLLELYILREYLKKTPYGVELLRAIQQLVDGGVENKAQDETSEDEEEVAITPIGIVAERVARAKAGNIAKKNDLKNLSV